MTRGNPTSKCRSRTNIEVASDRRPQRRKAIRLAVKRAVDAGEVRSAVCTEAIDGYLTSHSDRARDRSNCAGVGTDVPRTVFADNDVLALDKGPGGSFFFAENGDASFKEIAEMVSRSLGFGGRTVSLSVEDLVRKYGEAGRSGIASNSRVSAANARRLGWSPKGPSLAEYIERLR